MAARRILVPPVGVRISPRQQKIEVFTSIFLFTLPQKREHFLFVEGVGVEGADDGDGGAFGVDADTAFVFDGLEHLGA